MKIMWKIITVRFYDCLCLMMMIVNNTTRNWGWLASTSLEFCCWQESVNWGFPPLCTAQIYFLLLRPRVLDIHFVFVYHQILAKIAKVHEKTSSGTRMLWKGCESKPRKKSWFFWVKTMKLYIAILFINNFQVLPYKNPIVMHSSSH